MESKVEYFTRSASSQSGATRSERKRSVDEKRLGAIAALRAHRDAKAARVKSGSQNREFEDFRKEIRDDAKLKSYHSSDDSGYNSTERRTSSSSSSNDGERNAKKRRIEEVELQYADSKDRINEIRLSRFKLERLLHMPLFARVVNGCFVRVNVGPYNFMPVYRVAQIVGVCENLECYSLGNTRTNKYLKLRLGAQDKEFRLEYISNEDFLDSEFSMWHKATKDAGKKPPTIQCISNKITEVEQALTYEFTEEEVKKFVKEKQQHPTKKLDKTRTPKLKVETAEKASVKKNEAMKGEKPNDPFTRRPTKPVMVSNRRKFQPQKAIQVQQPQPAIIKAPQEAVKTGVYALPDLDVDLSLLAPALPAVDLPVITLTRKLIRDPKQFLSFEEHMKRQGFL